MSHRKLRRIAYGLRLTLAGRVFPFDRCYFRLNPKSLPRALSQPDLCHQLKAWLPFRVRGHLGRERGAEVFTNRSAPLFVLWPGLIATKKSPPALNKFPTVAFLT